LPITAEINGVRMLVTNDVTTGAKRCANHTATARSMTLPRIMNCRNPLNMTVPPGMDDTRTHSAAST